MKRRPKPSVPVGARIRIRDESIWPERAGCIGTVVEPRSDGVYPQPASWEVLVKLDSDPLRCDCHDSWWTCVVGAADVDILDGEAES